MVRIDPGATHIFISTQTKEKLAIPKTTHKASGSLWALKRVCVKECVLLLRITYLSPGLFRCYPRYPMAGKTRDYDSKLEAEANWKDTDYEVPGEWRNIPLERGSLLQKV